MTYAPAQAQRGSAADRLLVGLYLLGIYVGVAVHLPGGVPVPDVVAGAAGLALLANNAGEIRVPAAATLIAVLVIGVASALSAPGDWLLFERFKGFVQLAYSLLIGYGLFLAASRLPRHWLARVFLVLCLAILVGGALETAVPAFKAVSDAFRGWAFDFGVYNADLRDELLYGRIRPKVFTSEPSFVAFSYTLFAFAWYVLSRRAAKAVMFVGLLAVGYVLLRSPTMLIGVGLVPVYEVLLASRCGPAGARRLNWGRATTAAVISAGLAVGGLVVAQDVLAERIHHILSGHDPSFFSRIIAPPIIAAQVIHQHPFTGVGITGWEYLSAAVNQLYATTHWLAMDTGFDSAQHALTNYFWLHWIFLGLFWGTVMIVALSWYLRRLGVPSVLFCWAVWVVFGQAAGGYVDPRTWSVLILAAILSVVHERDVVARAAAAATQVGPIAPMPLRRPGMAVAYR